MSAVRHNDMSTVWPCRQPPVIQDNNKLLCYLFARRNKSSPSFLISKGWCQIRCQICTTLSPVFGYTALLSCRDPPWQSLPRYRDQVDMNRDRNVVPQSTHESSFRTGSFSFLSPFFLKLAWSLTIICCCSTFTPKYIKHSWKDLNKIYLRCNPNKVLPTCKKKVTDSECLVTLTWKKAER